VHPNVAEIYRRKVRDLTETLAHPETRDEAAEAIRSLVGQVVLTPGEGRGVVKARLSGELMAILDFAAGRRPAPRPEVITTAVARPRNQLHRSPAPPAGLLSFSLIVIAERPP
jgi:site-specific DNA recombinase